MPQAAIVFSLVSLFGCQRVVIWPATLFLLLNLQLCLPPPLCRQSGGKYQNSLQWEQLVKESKTYQMQH